MMLKKCQIFIKPEKQEKHLEFKPWITDLHIYNSEAVFKTLLKNKPFPEQGAEYLHNLDLQSCHNPRDFLFTHVMGQGEYFLFIFTAFWNNSTNVSPVSER